jgi:hypothetical protein
MPSSKRVAELEAEFENAPITQELQCNGEAFVDVANACVATGLPVDL